MRTCVNFLMGLLFTVSLTCLAATGAGSSGYDTDGISPTSIPGIILQATTAGGKVMTFLPTQHDRCLEQFTPSYRAKAEDIIRDAGGLVMESYGLTKTKIGKLVDLVEEIGRDKISAKYPLRVGPHGAFILKANDQVWINYIDAASISGLEPFLPLGYLVLIASKSEVEDKGGFLKEGDTKWSFGDNTELAARVEAVFMDVYDKTAVCGLNQYFEHFQDIYAMKPGIVAALYHRLTEAPASKSMDSQLAELYRTKHESKPIKGLETMDEVIASLPISEVGIEDVRDDFDPTLSTEEYPFNLKVLHEELKVETMQKHIAGERSLGIRNRLWMPKYGPLLDEYGNIVCLHGVNHFSGEEGLITLGQASGWQWSVFDHATGAYNPFVYNWSDETHPFKTPDGKPLEI